MQCASGPKYDVSRMHVVSSDEAGSGGYSVLHITQYFVIKKTMDTFIVVD
jgi:hypothetical protein